MYSCPEFPCSYSGYGKSENCFSKLWRQLDEVSVTTVTGMLILPDQD